MVKFIFKRVISAIVTLFIVCTITFFLMNLIPGGPFLSERSTPQMEKRLNEMYGLDKPLFEQYKIYMGRLLKGDLGPSIKQKGYTVNAIIAMSFPVSARLGIVTMIFAVTVGIILGTSAAVYRNGPADRFAMFLSTIGIAVPGFVIGSLLVNSIGLKFDIPISGLDGPSSYILPVITLSMQPLSYISRLMRSNMLDALDQDYIKTARSKGLPKSKIIFKHALRNTIIPIITYVGPMTASILTGGFVTERIFSVPGLGKYFISSIGNRDYPMIMGTTIFLAALLITINLIVDILYQFIDPRIRLD